MSKKLTCPASAPALSVALSQQKESLYAGTSPRANRAVQASDKTATPKSGALSACRRRHCTHRHGACMCTPKQAEKRRRRQLASARPGAQGPRQPVQALVYALPRGRASALDEPVSASKLVQAKLLRELRGLHDIRQVLLVRQYQHCGVPHLLHGQHLGELLPGVLHTILVTAVHHEGGSLCAHVVVVVPPQLAVLVLPADVPNCEVDVLVLHDLHVEAHRGDRRHDLTELQLVQDRRLACSVQAHHDYPHLALAYDAIPQLRHGEAHYVL
mmetsp:Transcript_114119/g.369105  ORF Transcript_114119/g.369105 Transcript_114119/m.369105 type:complete len:271 (-) Transcript_114119:23-835(-)